MTFDEQEESLQTIGRRYEEASRAESRDLLGETSHVDGAAIHGAPANARDRPRAAARGAGRSEPVAASDLDAPTFVSCDAAALQSLELDTLPVKTGFVGGVRTTCELLSSSGSGSSAGGRLNSAAAQDHRICAQAQRGQDPCGFATFPLSFR